jgi:hypothetical protein
MHSAPPVACRLPKVTPPPSRHPGSRAAVQPPAVLAAVWSCAALVEGAWGGCEARRPQLGLLELNATFATAVQYTCCSFGRCQPACIVVLQCHNGKIAVET